MDEIFFIVDIDGTVCDSMGRVNELYTCMNINPLDHDEVQKVWQSDNIKDFFDEGCVKFDKIIPGSDKLLKLRDKFNAHLVFLTGRNNKFRDVTLNWLVDNFQVPRDVCLIMRTPEYDDMNMQEYKEKVFLEKLYGRHSKAHFIFFDDDKKVIPLYAKYGIVFESPKCWEAIVV